MAGRWDEEDWSLQLAAMGATENSMRDAHMGASDEVREATAAVLQNKLQDLTKKAATLKKESTQDIKAKNQKALDAFRKKIETSLPAGWKRVESRSKPGTYVYENTFTEERQAWIPTEPAIAPGTKIAAPSSTGDAKQEALKEKNRKALEAFKAASKAKQATGVLPDGWKKVASQSRPGEFVYENIYTEERVAWFPVDSAPKQALPEQAPVPSGKAVKAKVLYEYNATNEEEVDLAVGDVVVVEHQGDNGWWVGSNVRSGKLGLFPGGFVELL